jgi:hypothetical protein
MVKAISTAIISLCLLFSVMSQDESSNFLNQLRRKIEPDPRHPTYILTEP